MFPYTAAEERNLTPFIQPVILANAFLSLILIVWTFPARKHNARARLFIALMAEVFIYSFGYAQSLIQTSLEGIYFWTRFQYLGVAFFPATVLRLTIHFCFLKENKRPSPMLRLLLIPSFITLFSQWSYPATRLFYRSGSVTFSLGWNFITNEKGPLYHLHSSYVILALAVSLVLYGGMAVKSAGRERKNFLMMLSASLIPGLGYLTYLMGFHHGGLDPSPLFLSLVGPLLAYGIFSENLMGDLKSGKAKYFEKSPQPVFIFNREDMLIDWNRAADKILNLPRQVILNRCWDCILQEWGAREILHEESELQHGTEILLKDRIYASSRLPYTDSRGEPRGFLIVLSDITELKLSVANLKTAAQTDGLTGIYNRRTWEYLSEAALHRARTNGSSGSLLMIDLDHFKEVNDLHGHQTGDQVIQEVARRFTEILRDSDILGRYGGEEFCIWLADTGPEAALKVAQRCLAATEYPPVPTDSGDLTVTVSIGLSAAETVTAASLQPFIQNADKALYQAKGQGRNRTILGEIP